MKVCLVSLAVAGATLASAIASIPASAFVVNGNLVVNGDFEAGNTGFSSQYPYGVQSPPWYYITPTDPFSTKFGDHTSGTGNMMVVDGNIWSSLIVWQQTIPVSTFTSYDFSAWLAYIPSSPSYAQSPAQLTFQINGVQVGSTFTLSQISGQWQHFATTWNSNGSDTSATISIVDQNLDYIGNDFALDDISLNAVPEPPTILGSGIALGFASFLSFLKRKLGKHQKD